MSIIDHLKSQVIETREFTKRLINDMPKELWYEIPENSDSNFAWQIGHIFMAQNYHINSCVFGLEQEIAIKISLEEYSKRFYRFGSKQRSANKEFATPNELIDNLDFIYDKSIINLENASDDILIEDLIPTKFVNPVAFVKYEAISWSFKHEMWHCAEMEKIKILLGKQFQWIK